MSRRNHLHDEMRWRAVGMLQVGARQSAVARELNVHRSAIHRLWNHYQRDQNVSRRRTATNGRTDLYVPTRGSVTAVRYRDEILHPLVLSFIAAMGTDAIFMDDNARPHRAGLVRSYLESETIPQMAWPVRSPDLNPIEHVWEISGRWIASSTNSNKPYYRNGHYSVYPLLAFPNSNSVT
ncbi:hypothetical protein AVEN_150889-1 [Araneus ventricosus]|uniref:Tc1-like transposase DDE domain-containing protein n=1 Tax=Araneus ventricosus TaxID=182803 RepID=A0A4Y2CAA8_ARAVE|nr:hypothetical protein AVEN_150889-1 [Araneus ventricosus]